MAEKFRFFDPVMDEHGNYDREYNAQEFVEYFSALVTTGVMKGAGNQLAVTADNASMVTTLDTGIAFILGRYYENDTPLQHIHDTETVGKQRIDRIVIRMDNNAGNRYVKSFVKKGIASTAPIPPALTRDGEVHEISVAQVRIIGGQTFISAENVIDERGTDIICPWAGSRILPNFDDVALQGLIESQLTNGKSVKIWTGIGEEWKLPEKSLDNLTDTGFYFAFDNFPDANDHDFPQGRDNNKYFILVMKADGATDGTQTFIEQVAFSLGASGLSHYGNIYKRTSNHLGVFDSPWKKMGVSPPTEWIQATLESGWSHSPTGGVYYLKDEMGRVHINGQLHRPSNPTGLTTALKLPVGYRPKVNTGGFVGYGGGAVQADIQTSGSVYIYDSQIGYYMVNIIFATE